MSETSPRPDSSLPPSAALLADRAIIAVTGTDAAHFLQNLLTANIETLTPGTGCPAALLTPQGKMVAEMLVFDASDEEPLYLVDVGRGFADELVAKLLGYRLRAAVSIDLLDASTGVMVCLDAGDAEQERLHGDAFYTFADPRNPALGLRLYGPKEELEPIATALGGERATYHARRVALGIPEAGQDFIPADVFPHEVNLDQLGGIDFSKGCYIGQEVVSRMEHRGMARSRTMILRCLNGFGVIGGVEVRGGDKPLGRVGECYRDRVLAILRLDRVQEVMTAGETLTAGGVEVEVIKPGYAHFAFPMEIKTTNTG
jgi:tRNA-modifying protein YgfZ